MLLPENSALTNYYKVDAFHLSQWSQPHVPFYLCHAFTLGNNLKLIKSEYQSGRAGDLYGIHVHFPSWRLKRIRNLGILGKYAYSRTPGQLWLPWPLRWYSTYFCRWKEYPRPWKTVYFLQGMYLSSKKGFKQRARGGHSVSDESP